MIKKIDLLLKEKEITRKKLSEDLEIGKNQIKKWEKGEAVPNKATLFGIAYYLCTTPEYLLGATDSPTNEQTNFILSNEEILLINSYRSHPELQEAVNRILIPNKTSEAKLQIPIKKEAPKASEKELQFIRTAASTGNTGMDNGYKAPKQPYSKKDRAEIKKLKDIEDLE